MTKENPQLIAHDLIGYDGDRYIRIVGGRTLYESVLVRDGYEGWEKVRLVRLAPKYGRMHQINRYVDPDTPVELVDKPGRYSVHCIDNAPWGGVQWAIWDNEQKTWADHIGRFTNEAAARAALEGAT